MNDGTGESLVALVLEGIQTVDQTSVTVANALFVVAILFAMNWGLLLRSSDELRRTSMRFMLMNLVFGLGVLAMLRLPNIAQVEGKIKAMGALAYLPIIPDFLALCGMVLARQGKQILREASQTPIEHLAVLSALLLFELSSIITRQASTTQFIIIYSTLAVFVCMRAIWEAVSDANNDRVQRAVESIPFLLVVLAMGLRILTLYSGAPIVQSESHNTVGIMWGYFAALLLINITLIAQVTHLHIERIFTLASIDNLTGAWLRKKITQKAASEQEKFNRNKDNLSIIMFDIDHFKQINDSHGHSAGDVALRYAVNNVSSQLRKIDAIGRWGGEEFLVLLPNTSLKGALITAEKLRKSLEQNPLVWGSDEISITASFGVAELQPNMSFETLVGIADKAMYKAKVAGRNRVYSL